MFDIGQKINDYQVKALIGKGKQGQVYRVQGPHQKQYALKAIEVSRLFNVRATLKRCALQIFVQEQYAVQGRQMFFYKNEKFLILVTELCQNTLENLLIKNGEAIDQCKRLELMLGISKGMATLHKLNHIHRDFNFTNVLVGKDGKLKISDFGRLKDILITKESTVAGVNYYSAPQLFQGHSTSFASDIWAVGVGFMQLQVGRFFMQNRLLSPAQLKELLLDHIQKVKNVKIRELIARMLSFNQYQRPSIQTVVQNLNLILRELLGVQSDHSSEKGQLPAKALVQNNQFIIKKVLLKGLSWSKIHSLAVKTNLQSYHQINCAATDQSLSDKLVLSQQESAIVTSQSAYDKLLVQQQ